MNELSENKLKKIKGGALSPWAIVGIIAGLIFGIGVVDGYVRPYKCR